MASHDNTNNQKEADPLRNSGTNTVPTQRSPNAEVSPLLTSGTTFGNANNGQTAPANQQQQQYISSLMGTSLTAQQAYMNDIIGPHNRTTSIVSLHSTSLGAPNSAFAQPSCQGQAQGAAIVHHRRSSSVAGANSMCNIFVNNNPNIVHGRSATNTLLSNSAGYITRREQPAVDEYIAALENIHKTYLLGVEGVPALRGVNVEIKRGEFMVVFGTSGGGKSTLLNILGTIDVPTKGNLMLLDSRITDRTPDADLARIRCRHIGFVFQSFNLLSTMTAMENVSLPMIIAGDLTRKQIHERAEMLLTMVGLAHRLDHYPSMLSGGEQQRVTIARSLANEPDLLLMDEPTGDLDTKNTHLILSILLNLNREKRLTMVMVTHDVYMKPYADRILYLRDGRVGNIEVVPPSVNEHAYEQLLDLVEQDKTHVGEHVLKTDASGKAAASILRTSDDYETRNAMRPVDHSGMDGDMRTAVEMLFGRNKSMGEERVRAGAQMTASPRKCSSDFAGTRNEDERQAKVFLF